MPKPQNEKENVQYVQDLAEIDGPFQSPININFKITTKLQLPPLIWNKGEVVPKKMKMTNTGHTVILSGKWKSQRPYLTGGPLEGNYVFSQVHFHWGPNDSKGSEHTVSGESFPLEMHVAHFKTEYLTQESALREKDGMVVLVYFFKIQDEPNASLRRLLGSLPCIRQPGTSQQIDPRSILALCNPFKEDYFMYWGSVVTATCAHILLWILCREPFGISKEQMEEFRKVLDSSNRPIRRNSRDQQPLHKRNVFHVNASRNLDEPMLPVKKITGCYCKSKNADAEPDLISQEMKTNGKGCKCNESLRTQEEIEDERRESSLNPLRGHVQNAMFVQHAMVHSPFFFKSRDSVEVKELPVIPISKDNPQGCCFLPSKEFRSKKSHWKQKERHRGKRKKMFDSVKELSNIIDSLEELKDRTYKKINEMSNLGKEVRDLKTQCDNEEDQRWTRKAERIIARQKRFAVRNSQCCFSQINKLAEECNMTQILNEKSQKDENVFWFGKNGLAEQNLNILDTAKPFEADLSKTYKQEKFVKKAMKLIQIFLSDIKEKEEVEEYLKNNVESKMTKSLIKNDQYCWTENWTRGDLILAEAASGTIDQKPAPVFHNRVAPNEPQLRVKKQRQKNEMKNLHKPATKTEDLPEDFIIPLRRTNVNIKFEANKAVANLEPQSRSSDDGEIRIGNNRKYCQRAATRCYTSRTSSETQIYEPQRVPKSRNKNINRRAKDAPKMSYKNSKKDIWKNVSTSSEDVIQTKPPELVVIKTQNTLKQKLSETDKTGKNFCNKNWNCKPRSRIPRPIFNRTNRFQQFDCRLESESGEGPQSPDRKKIKLQSRNKKPIPRKPNVKNWMFQTGDKVNEIEDRRPKGFKPEEIQALSAVQKSPINSNERRRVMLSENCENNVHRRRRPASPMRFNNNRNDGKTVIEKPETQRSEKETHWFGDCEEQSQQLSSRKFERNKSVRRCDLERYYFLEREMQYNSSGEQSEDVEDDYVSDSDSTDTGQKGTSASLGLTEDEVADLRPIAENRRSFKRKFQKDPHFMSKPVRVPEDNGYKFPTIQEEGQAKSANQSQKGQGFKRSINRPIDRAENTGSSSTARLMQKLEKVEDPADEDNAITSAPKQPYNFVKLNKKLAGKPRGRSPRKPGEFDNTNSTGLTPIREKTFLCDNSQRPKEQRLTPTTGPDERRTPGKAQSRSIPTYAVTSIEPTHSQVIRNQQQEINNYHIHTDVKGYFFDKKPEPKKDVFDSNDLEYLIKLDMCINEDISTNLENSMNYVKTLLSQDYNGRAIIEKPPVKDTLNIFESANNGIVFIEMNDSILNNCSSHSHSDNSDDHGLFDSQDLHEENYPVIPANDLKKVLHEGNTDSSYEFEVSISYRSEKEKKYDESNADIFEKYIYHLGRGDESNTDLALRTDAELEVKPTTEIRPQLKKRKEKMCDLPKEMKEKLQEILEEEMRQIRRAVENPSILSGLSSSRSQTLAQDNTTESSEGSSEMENEMYSKVSEMVKQFLYQYKEQKERSRSTADDEKKSCM